MNKDHLAFLQHLDTVAKQNLPGVRIMEGAAYPAPTQKQRKPDAMSGGGKGGGKYPEPTKKQRKPNIMGDAYEADKLLNMEEGELVALIDNDEALATKADALDEDGIKELLASESKEDNIFALGALLRLERDVAMAEELAEADLSEADELAEIEAELSEMTDEQLAEIEAKLDEAGA